MNDYERKQWEALQRWQAQPPPPVARWLGKAAGPASQAVQNLIPTEALRLALSAVDATASRFAGQAALIRQARVARVEDLREAELALCDALAAKVRKRAMLAAGGGGALLGMAGGAGLVADVPALLLLAFRTIRRIGLCYGEAPPPEQARPLAIAIFALASANTVEEKQVALSALARPQDAWQQAQAAWRDGLERAAERELAKEAALMSLNNLALQAGRHLGWRKAAGAMPVVGALIGGSVNAWYLHDLANVARYCFQERWLRARYRQPGALPAPLAALTTA